MTSVKRWMAIQFPSYSYNVILLAREIDPIQIQISCFGNQTMSGQINRLPRERCRSPDCTIPSSEQYQSASCAVLAANYTSRLVSAQQDRHNENLLIMASLITQLAEATFAVPIPLMRSDLLATQYLIGFSEKTRVYIFWLCSWFIWYKKKQGLNFVLLYWFAIIFPFSYNSFFSFYWIFVQSSFIIFVCFSFYLCMNNCLAYLWRFDARLERDR